MRASPITWTIRALWSSLPLTLGDLVVAALDGRADSVRLGAILLAWALWAGGLLGTLVLQQWSLLLVRLIVPLAVLSGVVAATLSAPSALGWVGLASAAVAAVATMSAEVGHEFINGAAYGDEARFPLRPPAALLFGPIALVWAVTVVPVPAGLLALSARQWALGALLVLLGTPAAWWGVRVLARLTRRWCVLVPAGLTLVDDMALAEPTLMRTADIAAVGPAPADTTALDLSVGATGLIVQVDLVAPGGFVPAAPRGGVTEAVEAASILMAPSRPGALVRHTRARGLGTVTGAG